jgi:DMSO/TMAO reductase YedYZ molybdopterin-dependent catalytic subunit
VALCQAPATLVVRGVGGKSVTLSAADLAKLPQQTVKTTDHGTPATFEGVLLTDVLAKVDLPTGDKYHSTAASYYLLVDARDGYRAVFAWAELDSGFMDKAVYVVTKKDGQPLPDAAGPFQLVAPGEKRAARWVRQVTALTVKQAN